jgi:hypothetical protein
MSVFLTYSVVTFPFFPKMCHSRRYFAFTCFFLPFLSLFPFMHFFVLIHMYKSIYLSIARFTCTLYTYFLVFTKSLSVAPANCPSTFKPYVCYAPAGNFLLVHELPDLHVCHLIRWRRSWCSRRRHHRRTK